MSKGGRRGKYHEWLTEEGLTKLGGWARDGLTDEQIAKNIGISRSTLSEWKEKHPDILDTLKKNKEVADIQVENALFKRALGYEYEEVKTYIEEVDGVRKKRIEKTKKHMAPDTTAQIFWLRNRKGDVWGNKDALDRHKTIVDIKLAEAQINKTNAEYERITSEHSGGDVESIVIVDKWSSDNE